MFRKKSQLIFRIYGSKLGESLFPELIEIRLLVLRRCYLLGVEAHVAAAKLRLSFLA